ncbi:putative type IV secretory pathway VirD4 components [Thiobacillus denitrificans ATCC 25259]|uniref:Putative type IV secretory pathway VirD4 components n=1 Tax=Thiobacillus denitrificans (strain ATCC 25259 / T1) TaxID=292415 RepID=Q3SI88_THIDA|nr:type IV secretion system DNA-binding domain-containing protein [Thiobacillus denitrificans]AAZ97640.1 putative type IV secretory pathway VirD4 components [Thiobacillus denitrificans ATCC 25259]
MTGQATRKSNQPTGADRWGAPLFLGGLAGALAAAGLYLGGWGWVLQSQGLGFHVEPALHHLLPGRQLGDRLHDKTVAFMQAEHPAALKALEVGPQIAGLLAGGLVFWMVYGDVVIATQDRHIRGRRRLKGAAALAAWVKDEGEAADGLRIHPKLPPISKSRETRHILIVGGVGSGKTQTLLPLMRAARERGDRAIIFDFKGDFTPDFPSCTARHKGRAIEVEDVIFAPWDSRSTLWAVARDVDTLSAAREFAARMIVEPGGGSGSPMWANAARQVLVACLVELQSTKPGDWGFADLVAGLTRPVDQLTEAARRYFPEAVKALGDGQQNVTTAGIQINLMSYLAVIFDLARAWPGPGIFSIREWLTEVGARRVKTVILQHDGRFETLARAFNSAVLGLAGQLIKSNLVRDSKERKLWLFLDEFPELGKVETVLSLAAVGRSKGIRVVLGLQDISQVKKIYSEHDTNSIVSMVGTQVIAQVSPGETAKYIAENLIGDRDLERLGVSITSGAGRAPGIFTSGGNRTSKWEDKRELVVLPSELLQLGPDLDLGGVKVWMSGIGEDVLEVLIPFSDPNHFRPSSVIADWTRYPNQPIAPAVATPAQEPSQPVPSWAEEAAEADVAPLLVTPTSPAVTPVANPWADDIDGDEAGEGEESAPAPETTTATDPLAFLDDGESTEKTAAAEFETRMLPIATPLSSQLADQAKEEATESIAGELAQQVGIAALPSGIAEIAHAVEIADTLLDLGASAAMPPTEVLPVTEAGVQPPRKKKIRLKKSATAQLEESI